MPDGNFPFKAYSPNYTQHVTWALRHNIHFVGELIRKYGIGNPNSRIVNCKTCNNFETTSHVFATCEETVKVWKHFSPFLNNILEITTAKPNIHLALGFFTASKKYTTTQKMLGLTLITYINYHIWKTRCNNFYEQKNFDHTKTIFDILYDIRRFLFVKYRFHKKNNTLREFKTVFTYKNTLCRLENDTFVCII